MQEQKMGTPAETRNSEEQVNALDIVNATTQQQFSLTNNKLKMPNNTVPSSVDEKRWRAKRKRRAFFFFFMTIILTLVWAIIHYERPIYGGVVTAADGSSYSAPSPSFGLVVLASFFFMYMDLPRV